MTIWSAMSFLILSISIISLSPLILTFGGGLVTFFGAGEGLAEDFTFVVCVFCLGN